MMPSVDKMYDLNTWKQTKFPELNVMSLRARIIHKARVLQRSSRAYNRL